MKRKSVSPLGALHPILFFAGVYVVALFFSIFICSSIFYSCNTVAAREKQVKEKPPVVVVQSNSLVTSK